MNISNTYLQLSTTAGGDKNAAHVLLRSGLGGAPRNLYKPPFPPPLKFFFFFLHTYLAPSPSITAVGLRAQVEHCTPLDSCAREWPSGHFGRAVFDI